jgi:hypothetical protein
MKATSSSSRWVLGALLAASGPAARAVAAQPPEAPPEAEVRERAAPPVAQTPEATREAEESADAQAARWQRRADDFRRLGGAAYRLGLVQRAEGMAAKYRAAAAMLRARAAIDPATLEAWDAQALRYRRLVAQYENMGGAAYRDNLVQAAQAQARKYELAPMPPAPPPARLYHEWPPFKRWLN